MEHTRGWYRPGELKQDLSCGRAVPARRARYFDGVAAHPNDIGMQMIAERIIAEIYKIL